jgi:tetratricopeptide (TPR) repeat protein/TolB-like protein
VASKFSLFLAELKRRKVTRVAVVYALVGIGVIEGAQLLFEALALPLMAWRVLAIVILLGFPVALVLAWAVEVTPEGIQRTPDLTPEQLASQTPERWSPSSWVLAGAGLVVVLAIGYFLLFRGTEEAQVIADDHRVAVLPLENLTGDPSLDGLSLTAADWVTDGLVRTELFRVVPFNEVMASSDALSDSERSASALALAWPEETGATVAVLGSFSPLGDSVQFRLRIVDRDGTVLRAVQPVSGAGENPSEALGGLQTRVMGAVARVLVPGHELAFSASGRDPPHPDAHEAYLEGLRLVRRSTQGDASALEYMQRALEIDPEYLNPLLLTPPILWNLDRYSEADSVCQIVEGRSDEFNREERLWWQLECSQHPARELDAAKQLAESAPNLLQRVAMHALGANQPLEAIEACSGYDPTVSRMMAEWAGSAWSNCMAAFHILGDYEGELEFIFEKRGEDVERFSRQETRALIALGRLDEAEELIERRLSNLGPNDSPISILNRAAQEYDAHGDPDAAKGPWERALQWLSSLPQETLDSVAYRREKAETLLFLERNEEALVWLEGLAGENPDVIADQGRLGVARAALGNRIGAEEISQVLVPMDQPFRRGANTAWRSFIAARLGDLDEAVRLLDQAIAEGWPTGLTPHRSPYLKPLRGFEPYERLVAPGG